MNPTPVQVASLAIALLQSESFNTLLQFSSPFIRERHSMLSLPMMELFQWIPDKKMEIYLQNVDLSTHSCFYKVFDSQTTHCIVTFELYTHETLGIVLLYMQDQQWTFHDVKLVLDLEGWSSSHQLAKQEFSLKPEEMLVDDEYWDMYTQETKVESPKRPIEEVDDTVDYWDRY